MLVFFFCSFLWSLRFLSSNWGLTIDILHLLKNTQCVIKTKSAHSKCDLKKVGRALFFQKEFRKLSPPYSQGTKTKCKRSPSMQLYEEKGFYRCMIHFYTLCRSRKCADWDGEGFSMPTEKLSSSLIDKLIKGLLVDPGLGLLLDCPGWIVTLLKDSMDKSSVDPLPVLPVATAVVFDLLQLRRRAELVRRPALQA